MNFKLVAQFLEFYEVYINTEGYYEGYYNESNNSNILALYSHIL